MGKSDNIWIPKTLIQSRAFRALRTPTAHVVLAIFWTKRQMVQVGRRGKGQWAVANNDEIEFTYLEADSKWGISASVFRNAIDELRNKGFLDIAESGAGLYKSKNKYTLSERWRRYGTPDYEPPKPRPKGPVNRGFKKGNRLGRNARRKISTVVGQHSSIVAGQHGLAESDVGRVVCAT